MLSLKKASTEFTKHPFVFIWPSLIYVALQILFMLAALGLFLLYFLLASVLNLDTGLYEYPTIVALGAVAVVFLFFTAGLNAGLARGYHDALENKKTTLADFFRYSLQKSPIMFGIVLLREIIYMFVVGPVVALYIYALTEYQYVDILVGLYVLFATFIVHFLFTPAFVSAGALGTSLFQSMRNCFQVLRNRHIMVLGLFFIFAILWVFNFIPFVQMITIFALYPIVYSALIVMVKENV